VSPPLARPAAPSRRPTPDNLTVPGRQLLPAELLDFAILEFTRFSVPVLAIVVGGIVDVTKGGALGAE
jgi:hypothetical protein